MKLLVKKRGGIYMFAGEVGSREPPAPLLGFELAGNLAAAAVSWSFGRNGSFLRSAKKGHGSRQQVEGAASREEEFILVVAEGKEETGLESAESCGCRISSLQTLRVIETDQISVEQIPPSELVMPRAQQEYTPPTPKVPVLSGDFRLSGGGVSPIYYDSVAPSTDFNVLTQAIAARADSTDGLEAIAGVGMSGCYAGVAFALSKGLLPLVVDPVSTGMSSSSPVIGKGLLLVDDYVSTGKSLELAAAVADGFSRGGTARKLSLFGGPSTCQEARAMVDVVWYLGECTDGRSVS